MNLYAKTVVCQNFSYYAKVLTMLSMLSLCVFSTTAFALVYGVNIRQDITDTVANKMQTTKLINARIDLVKPNLNAAINATGVNKTYLDSRRAQIQRIKDRGGIVQASVQTSYQWWKGANNTEPTSTECQNKLNDTVRTGVPREEEKAYNETRNIVNAYSDLISDFELLNEVQLRPESKTAVAPNSAISSAPEYSAPTLKNPKSRACYALLAKVLRGMYNGITNVRQTTGRPLRVIMGVVGRDFGFATYIRQNGVHFDVLGYHLYPHYRFTGVLAYDPNNSIFDTNSLLDKDTWYGNNEGLIGQLNIFRVEGHSCASCAY